MPLSSMDIAQMNGAFQNGAMNNMVQSGMVGQHQGHIPTGEQFAGHAANFISGVAAPVGIGLSAMAGISPLQMGAKAAWGARGAGGLAAGAAGIAAMAPMMALGAGVDYVGNQLMTGMQQQQQFNSSMRSNFNFINPSAHGGRGFNSTDTATISSNLRSMAGSAQGPMGEMVGFEELGRLAGNMGRMGMAQGVRSAKEFSSKFKEMVGTLKEIATAFGTNLEEAQQMMGAMRQSGVSLKNTGKFAKGMSAVTASGTIAVTEASAAMNIGSQISRSIGGRGQSGAAAGLRNIGLIGAATDSGLLSDDDVYEATGLRGAEGRQALNTNQLGQAANFLQKGVGTRFLASLAGKDGKLNEASVRAWERGGISTDETMRMAHANTNRNLGGIGQANFLINKGKLSGEALAQFGGLVPAMAMKSWLQEKGISFKGEGRDKAMLAYQRYAGGSVDENERTMQEVENLPMLLEQQRKTSLSAGVNTQAQLSKSTRGIEGLKRSFDKAKATVNNAVQKAGADIFEDAADTFEKLANKATGQLLAVFDQTAAKKYDSLSRSSAGSADRKSAMASLGLGGQGSSALFGAGAEKLRSGTFGNITKQGAGSSDFFQKMLGIGTVTGDKAEGLEGLKFGSEQEKNEALGSVFRGRDAAGADASRGENWAMAGGAASLIGAGVGAGLVGSALGAISFGLLAPIGMQIGAVGGAAAGAAATLVAHQLWGQDNGASAKDLGASLLSDEAQTLREGALSADEDTKKATLGKIDTDIKTLEQKVKDGEASGPEKADLERNKSIKTLSAAQAIAIKKGVKVSDLTDADYEGIGKSLGISGEQARGHAEANVAAYSQKEMEARNTAATTVAKSQGLDLRGALTGKLAQEAGSKEMKLTAEASDALGAVAGTAGKEYAAGMLAASELGATFEGGDDNAKKAMLEKQMKMRDTAKEKLSGMTGKQIAALGAGLSDQGMGDLGGGELSQLGDIQSRIEKAQGKGKKGEMRKRGVAEGNITAGLSAAAEALGITISEKQLRAAGSGPEEQARAIAKAGQIDFTAPGVKDSLMGLAKATNPHDRAEKSQSMLGGAVGQALQKSMVEKKEKKDAADNPLQAKMVESLKITADAAVAAAKSRVQMQVSLDAIAHSTKGMLE